uniref:Protein kinase domain-containing protein n=2 Tax=Glycine max TaxID=3847 RepID=K7KAC6_SOYBN
MSYTCPQSYIQPCLIVVISPSPSSWISKGALAGIVLGAIACAVTLSATGSILILRTRLRDYGALSRQRNASRILVKIDGVRSFDYNQMALASNNVSESAQIGQGGYGKREFLTEIELLSRLHHRNLVSLIGYCDQEGEQMLVYEYMSNGALRNHLSVQRDLDIFIFNKKEKKGSALTVSNNITLLLFNHKFSCMISMRLKIALGSAKGLLYQHTEANPPIFRRDVKASNILLDSRYTAKVADFGPSRLAPVLDIEGNVPGHVSTVVKGTPGYLDPEYFLTYKLTDKSDVYSLGENIIRHAWFDFSC